MSGNLSAELNAGLENQCSIHPEEVIITFCKSHDALCCVKCDLKHHKDCSNMVDIEEQEQETLDRNSQHLLGELKHIEEHLLKYIARNQSNLERLQQEVENVLTSIKEAKYNVSKLMTQFECGVKTEANRVYDEDHSKKSEEIIQCQSLLAEVQASTQRLDSVILNGNKTQNFVAEYQEQKRMVNLRDKVFRKYGKIKSRNVKITLCGDLASLLSLPKSDDLGKVETEEKTEPLTRNMRTLDDGGSVKISRCFDIWHMFYSSDYSGAAILSTGYVILIDKNMRMCCLFDSQYRHISHYRFSTDPGDICVFNDEDMAVSLPNEKKIQFLKCTVRVRNGKFQFTQSSSINTKYYCDGLAFLAKDKVVISGYNDTGNKNYFWSILTTSGKEEYHEINQNGGKGTYLATNKSKTCIIMSCFDINTVYCFGLDGQPYFTYTNEGLVEPMGIGVDKDGNIYVVGRMFQNIHQLSQDGSLKQLLSPRILTAPQKIAFSVDGLTYLITNKGEGNKCCIFQLQ